MLVEVWISAAALVEQAYIESNEKPDWNESSELIDPRRSSAGKTAMKRPISPLPSHLKTTEQNYLEKVLEFETV